MIAEGAPAHLVDDLEAALDAGGEAAAAPSPIKRGAVPRELLVKPTVGGLVRDALVDWAWLGVFWAAMAFAPTWSYPLWALLVAGRIHAFGVILHDAAHMPLRGKPPAVRLLEVLSGYPLAITLDAMRYHHIRHHRDSGMATDPYFKSGLEGRPHVWMLQWLRGLLLMPFWTIRAPFGLLAVVIPALRVPYGRAFLQDKSGEDMRASREVLACAKAEAGQLIFQAGVIAALVVWTEPVLYGYVIPAAMSGLLASFRLLNEHAYVPTTDRRPETILATTQDHNLGWLGRLVVAPKNIGFHVVHHLHPQVSWRALPALRDWYRSQHPERYPAPRRMWALRLFSGSKA